MFWRKKERSDLRGRWSDVFKTLGLVTLIYLSIRWIGIEPFVIPSGSMKPSLLIQDYVVVKKWAYGLRIPLTQSWLIGPLTPQRGDIVVFRSKEDNYHFMVKRVVGLPGDKIKISSEGRISINGEEFKQAPGEDNENFDRFQENNGRVNYRVQYEPDHIAGNEYEEEVPEGHIFMMGDNRDHSMDSRYWGSLPLNKVLGQVSLVWMSCEDSDKVSNFLCPMESIRWPRVMKVIH